MDLVLALALVALVLGVIYWGSIVLRLLNWSFDFWLELVIEFAKLISEALILFCKKRLYPRECCSTGGLLHCS
jgi:hypothetical protein